jgi:Fur family ferric uptake transcriptional regulator
LTDDAELKKAGLKVTLPRLRILELLEDGDKSHLSAEEIYRRLIDAGEEVGLATVYRVLTQFEQAGICIRHNFEEGHAVYELTPRLKTNCRRELERGSRKRPKGESVFKSRR